MPLYGPPEVRHLLWIRGFFAIMAVYFAIASFGRLTLSEGITLFSIRPFPIALLCYMVLAEPCTRTPTGGCRRCRISANTRTDAEVEDFCSGIDDRCGIHRLSATTWRGRPGRR